MTVRKNDINTIKSSANIQSVGGGVQKALSTSHVPRGGDKMKIEAKSRYLEVKKPRASQPGNNNVNAIKQRDNMSSSETSTRTTSPMMNRKWKNPAKLIDSNMSLDSLASPIKHQAMNRSAILQVHHDNDGNLSRDSLAESIRSSVRTEKTVSHESLVIVRPLDKPKPAKVNPQVNGIKRNVHKSSNDSTSGSSSSVAVNNKGGGKLMRNFSDSGVTLRVKNNKKLGGGDVSSNSNSSNASARTSFLSKKSKEILEKRAQSMANHYQSVPQCDNKLKPINSNTADVRRSLPINKSSSTSNIPTNRRIFSTTLHLRKTADLFAVEVGQPRGRIQPKTAASTVSKLPQKVQAANPKTIKESSNIKREKEKKSLEKAFEVLEIENDDPDLYESKLVRSSTFSKECSDLNLGIEIN